MNNTPNKIYITWEQVHDWTNDISKQCKSMPYDYDAIIGVERGGLIPAVILSHKMKIPLYSVKCSFRDHADVKTKILPSLLNLKPMKYLCVDDINDTGKTFEYLKEQFTKHDNDVDFAVIHDNIPSSFDVDYSAVTIDKSKDPSWIVYPWEVDKSSK